MGLGARNTHVINPLGTCSLKEGVPKISTPGGACCSWGDCTFLMVNRDTANLHPTGSWKAVEHPIIGIPLAATVLT